MSAKVTVDAIEVRRHPSRRGPHLDNHDDRCCLGVTREGRQATVGGTQPGHQLGNAPLAALRDGSCIDVAEATLGKRIRSACETRLEQGDVRLVPVDKLGQDLLRTPLLVDEGSGEERLDEAAQRLDRCVQSLSLVQGPASARRHAKQLPARRRISASSAVGSAHTTEYC